MARILIVEDDPLLITMYETKFKKENFEVLTASDGMKALEIVKSERVDLVILDFMMPKLSGMDFLKQIRATEGLKNMKILMLSNMNNPAEIEKVKQLGALDFLVKADYTPSQVVEKVKGYLN